jgi:predicted transport protein
MPQNENLSDEWQTELGPDWKRIQDVYLHTLGNLTLTGYNSEYSDKPFMEKRNMKGGFLESPLRLNKIIGNQVSWSEKEILDRADVLSEQAIHVWISPKLESSILESYKPKVERSQYSIVDHPHLMSEPIASLFNELRKQILALDPCVTESFLKNYVAYKAETNFVDIIPQGKRLLLILNVSFPEINDPKSICRDIAGLGRWGNGDVEVGLSEVEEMPYVMGLVSQAFEKQMGQEVDN